jgi:hypothetical protein
MCALSTTMTDFNRRDRYGARPFKNPKGISSPSPGLGGTTNPGKSFVRTPQLRRSCATISGRGRNPVWVGRVPRPEPRVCAGRQPWAGGRNPVGIRNNRKIDRCVVSKCWAPTDPFVEYLDATPLPLVEQYHGGAVIFGQPNGGTFARM